jgi:putative heme transporter
LRLRPTGLFDRAPELNLIDVRTPLSRNTRRLLQGVLSLAVVVGIFAFALPRVANFSSVWESIRAMTWFELASLALIAAWNIVTYWFVMVASMPGLNYWQAMKVNQTSTAIANTMPGGGALGIGVTTAMLLNYGFSKTEIGLSILVTGIWNNFVKLGMPVIALALLALGGGASPALLTASLIGLLVLAGAIVLFALILKSEELARRVGAVIGRFLSWARQLLKRAPLEHFSDSVVRFRRDTLELLQHHWVALTAATVVSHFSLYLVLLMALRHVGVPNAAVSWQEVLAAFAFIRLVSALPITPGGLGVVELGLTAALVAAGGNEPNVVAAVLVYRALTYLAPIPFGAASYLFWRKGANRRALARAEAKGVTG